MTRALKGTGSVGTGARGWRFVVCVVCAAMVVGGCITDDLKKDDENDTGRALDAYIPSAPAEVVTTWRRTTAYTSGTDIIDFTGRVAKSWHDDGVDHLLCVTSIGDTIDVGLWHDRIRIWLDDRFVTPYLTGPYTTDGMSPFGMDYAFFDFASEPGDRRTVMEIGLTLEDTWLNVDVYVTTNQRGRVSVPAGSWDECASFELETTFRSTPKVGGDDQRWTITVHDTWWFAPGIGPVKRVSVVPGPVAMTVTDELLGFTP